MSAAQKAMTENMSQCVHVQCSFNQLSNELHRIQRHWKRVNIPSSMFPWPSLSSPLTSAAPFQSFMLYMKIHKFIKWVHWGTQWKYIRHTVESVIITVGIGMAVGWCNSIWEHILYGAISFLIIGVIFFSVPIYLAWIRFLLRELSMRVMTSADARVCMQ